MGYMSFSSVNGLRRQTGFTLLELLVTLAVAAVLVAIAVPSYRDMVERNAMAASTNDLVGSLNYARSEAVTRGRETYVCPTQDKQTCTGQGRWTEGWIVYAPDPGSDIPTGENLLQVHGSVRDQLSIEGASELVFDANGFTTNYSNLRLESPESNETRLICIARSGRIESHANIARCSDA